MGRERRQTVDFFPHYVKSGRTIYILENRYGNDGYAFWFKLLEILGESEGHSYDCSNTTNWEFLLAKTRIDVAKANDIINTLIGMGKVDKDLWEKKRILWVQRLVDNVTNVYSKRAAETPQKPCFGDGKPDNEIISVAETPQRREEERKEEERKEEESREDRLSASGVVDLWNSICGNAGLPRVEKLTDSRRKKIKIRLAEFGDSEKEQTETLKDILNAIAASSFLRGENKSRWTATFDWLVTNSENWAKVLEGNYSDTRGQRPVRTGQPAPALGVGEFVDGTGRRTYGTGRITIPRDAPPRPSDKYCWSAESNNWVML